MSLIKYTSALTLNVSGTLKDVLLIAWSVMVSGATVTSVQCAGYSLALGGAIFYSHEKRRQQANAAADIPHTALLVEEQMKLSSLQYEEEQEDVCPASKTCSDILHQAPHDSPRSESQPLASCSC
eukprot:CAMPEP_0119316362 /NCGR_PEP_ID=MMETSP1333-20130426/39434_1 /TAXON_ID=418940 /ORGANISM="Scyphosphaera apsteinii, Strain RCC1455" /LENGTH=124 /DNA_ID=CAMNT_0007321985 /DNA_START=758 /DNA_END=1132 /DNA_ORIENTATION=+